jgi:hypothetical protein
MGEHIETRGPVVNPRTLTAQEVVDTEHGRPGRVIAFWRDPYAPKGINPGDRFTVEWADGTESDHVRREFVRKTGHGE